MLFRISSLLLKILDEWNYEMIEAFWSYYIYDKENE